MNMNPESKLAVALFKNDGVISQQLSHQYEIAYPISSLAERADWSNNLLSVAEVRSRYPDIIDAIEHRSMSLNVQDSVVRAFKMDTSFLSGNGCQSRNNYGIVFILPKEFSLSIFGLINQKPTLHFARAINYRGYSESYAWKVEQDKNSDNYDLLVSVDEIDVTARSFTEEEDYSCCDYWTDMIFCCGDIIGVGGFYYSEQDSVCIQVDSYGPTNYKPFRHFSEGELEEADERAEGVGSIAPWFEQICINEDGRRYRQVEVVR